MDSGIRRRLERAEKFLRRNDLDAAAREAGQALQLAPDEPLAHNVMGLVHLERREHAKAMVSFSTANRLREPFPEALINLAVACNRVGQHALALRACELALAASPDHPLALVNQGMAWKGLRLFDPARRAFERAGAHPMALFNLGHTWLLENDLERGLPLLEHRRTLLRTGAGLRGTPWTGESRPEATLLVAPEQGLGDFILMSRFFAPLADCFERVLVHTPKPLAPLVAGLDPRLEVVTSLAKARWDLWAPIMSLPLLLGIRRIEEVPTAPWIGPFDAGPPRARPRIGLNWAGNPSFAYDQVRSTSLATFAPLFAILEVEWVSLHKGVREAEAEAVGLPQPLREATDFLDTAQVIAGLDLVISTETAIPNLSAAMGVPTCVVSVADVDWRWSQWYRGVTVCAQREPNDWAPAVEDVVAVVRSLALESASRPAA